MIIKNISNKDLHWINIALKLSELSPCKFRHGAIIVSKGKPLSLGINTLKKKNIQKYVKQGIDGERPEYSVAAEERRSKQESSHAEYCAIRKARRGLGIPSLKGTCIYSARSLKNGDPGSSFPCVSCLQVILMEEIKHIVYFENDVLKKAEF